MRVRLLRFDARGCVHAVHIRHDQVHQHHVGLELLGAADALLTVASLANDFDVRLELEICTQAFADHAVIVDDQHPDPARRGVIRHADPPAIQP